MTLYLAYKFRLGKVVLSNLVNFDGISFSYLFGTGHLVQIPEANGDAQRNLIYVIYRDTGYKKQTNLRT